MPTPEEEQIDANINLLLAVQFNGMNAADRQNLLDSVEEIRADYALAAEKAKTSKYYKDVADSIAKSLPGIVKGAHSAAQAFEKGDYITGSAALMDVCSSLIPVFASLSSAGGPPGVLIGALFSVVGQILSFFAPKQPSLESKIQKMLDQLQSETEIRNITAFGHSVHSYTSTLRQQCMGVHTMEEPAALAGTVAVTPGSKTVSGTGTTFTSSTAAGEWLSFDADASGTVYKIGEVTSDTSLTLATPFAGQALAESKVKHSRRTIKRRGIDEILAMPLTNETQADDFLVAMKALKWGLVENQTKLDAPVFANWQVAGYLERPANQSKEGWPEVLGVWCHTYIDLLTANTMLTCMADPKTLDRLLVETQASNKHSPLHDDARKPCHAALISLKALVKTLHDSWESDRKEMRKIVEAIRPAARERGLYAHLGWWQNSNVLYIATGTGTAEPLGWNYKKNTGWLRSISINVPKSQKDSYTPKYEVIACETSVNRIARHTLDAIAGTLSDGVVVIDPRYHGGERFLDAAGIPFNDDTPGVDLSKHPVTLIALAIEDNAPGYYVNYYTLDKEIKSTRVNTEPRMAGTRTLRCLYLPPTPVQGDPDGDALIPSPQNAVVVYGGVLDANHVHVMEWISPGTVKGPKNWSSYNGIEVDSDYVWLFGKGGIACATHASMLKCKRGQIPEPKWIYHDFDKQFTAPEVKSLSPCADGSLLAMLGEIYSADYTINRGTNRIETKNWVKRGGDAKQVVKMPIPCWTVLESLKASLQAD